MLPRFLAFALTLVAALSLAACGKDEAPAPPTSLAVSLVPVSEAVIERSVVVSGPVTAWEEMQLGVELSGVRITALHVDVGQAVKQGDVLLELDARSASADLAQADAALAEARAGLELAQANVRRAEPLASQQLISAAQLDELRAQRSSAQARVGTAQAARDNAALRRDFARLRAPADGIISKRLVQPGQIVGAGSELLRLIRDGRLEWRAELAESELAQVSVGDTVSLPSRQGPVSGTVRAVSPGVDAQTRTGTVHADLPDPGSLQAGSYVEGRIQVGQGKGLTVPSAAVVLRDGHPYVFTVDAEGIARRLRVRTGASLAGRTELLDGVAAGQSVVLEGAGFLGDGDKVRVVSGSSTPAAAAAGKAGDA
jgi:RND family efflux transporter MFP subunit